MRIEIKVLLLILTNDKVDIGIVNLTLLNFFYHLTENYFYYYIVVVFKITSI